MYCWGFSRPSSANDSAVEFEATKSQIVGAGAVFANLDDTEVSESVEANFSVYVGIDTPGGNCSFLAQKLLFLFESSVIGWVSRQIQAPVEDRPVDFVIGAFEMPIQQNVSWAISVSNRVTSWQKLSLLPKVNAKVGEWLVSSSAVDHLSSNKVLRSA